MSLADRYRERAEAATAATPEVLAEVCDEDLSRAPRTEEPHALLSDVRADSSLSVKVLRGPAYAVRRRVIDARYAVRWAWQRVVRGWDDRALWNVGSHLTKTLGEQLVTMGKLGISYPGDLDPNEWRDTLVRHGEALQTFYRRQDDVDTGEEWDAIHDPAREALLWVADNFPGLWD